MNESLMRHTSKFHFSPSFIPSISCSPLLSLFSSIKASSSSFLSKAHSWWWSSLFHGLFPSEWCLPSPLLLCLPMHLHGGKSPLKDLIEAQRSSLHRSSTSKLPSCGSPKQDVVWGVCVYQHIWDHKGLREISHSKSGQQIHFASGIDMFTYKTYH